MGETCEVCGREKIVRGHGFQEDRCWRGFLGQDDLKCYRLGYSRSQEALAAAYARAEKAEAELAAVLETYSGDIKYDVAMSEALAAARRECDLLRAELAKCGNISAPYSQMRPEKP